MSRFIAMVSAVLALSSISSVARAQSSLPLFSDLAGRERPATDLVPRSRYTLAGAPGRGRAELSLVVGVVQRPKRRDVTASALLTLPLPEWMGQSIRASAAALPPAQLGLVALPILAYAPAAAHKPNTPHAPGAPHGSAAHHPGSAMATHRPGAAHRPGAIQPVRASEPAPWLPRLSKADIVAAVEASQDNASETAALGRLDDMVNRARWSALLPELRLRATRLVDESASFAPTSYDDDRTTSSGGVSLWLEGRASWRLDRALFADQELRAEQQRRQLEKARQQLALQTTAALFGWLRAVYAARDPLLAPEQCLDAWLREQRHSAELDLLTAGWHRQWLSRKPALSQPWCAQALQERGTETESSEASAIDAHAATQRLSSPTPARRQARLGPLRLSRRAPATRRSPASP